MLNELNYSTNLLVLESASWDCSKFHGNDVQAGADLEQEVLLASLRDAWLNAQKPPENRTDVATMERPGCGCDAWYGLAGPRAGFQSQTIHVWNN